MKTCPNCKELVGDSADTCFNCNYSFYYKRVVTQEEKTNTLAEKNAQLEANAQYEYATEVIDDNSNGTLNQQAFNSILSVYAGNGWRLHSMLKNEVGNYKTETFYSFSGQSITPSIGQTIIVFERCIKSGSAAFS